jgi:dTDP-4-dehydrorhamnose reductase
MSAVESPPARWFVAGAKGMLGRDLLAALAGIQGREVTGLDLPELDITDAEAVAKAVAGHDVVVNCAAYTAVDAAETAEALAFAVNAVGPANLARAAALAGIPMLHISTDYVFSGEATSPYPVDAPISPRSAYGRTKAAGEWAVRAELPASHWILRTAWLYGANGANFPRTMARLERERETLDVVDDQHGQPTWSRDLAARIVEVVDAGAPSGTYHATSAGETTWHGLAREVFTLIGADPDRVRATTSEAFVRPAPRPPYSVLSHDAWALAGLAPMRPWQEALHEAAAAGVIAPQ